MEETKHITTFYKLRQILGARVTFVTLRCPAQRQRTRLLRVDARSQLLVRHFQADEAKDTLERRREDITETAH